MQEQIDQRQESQDIESTPRISIPLTNFDYSDADSINYEKTIKVFSEGDIIAGTVVKIDKDEVLLDIGYKSEGVIPLRELSIRYGVRAEDVVKVGDVIDALVLQKEDKEGRLILSKKRAQYEKAWGVLEEKMLNNEPVEGEVIEVVKGGLILDIGLRGFLPASLVDVQRVRDLESFLGQRLTCKIIEMDRNRNNVVLSRRAYLEEKASERKKVLLDNLKKGMRVKGKVSSLVSFGAFVNLGGIDGLIHISELSWCHVEKPSEVLSVGDEVEVEVLEVDKERERISLSLKACQSDPWEEIYREVRIGDILEGKITKLVPFGAFVQVKPAVEGLVHISEISRRHIDHPEEVLSVGDTVQVKVVDMDIDRRRLSLSIRQAAEELGLYVDEEGEPASDLAPDTEAEATASESATDSSVQQLESEETDAGVESREEVVATPAVEESEVEETEELEPAEEAEEPSDEAPAGETETASAKGEETLEDIIQDLKREGVQEP
ncbi:MAG: 30S ribosomal protein S1 [Candidatus Geothermincolales bacterium]